MMWNSADISCVFQSCENLYHHHNPYEWKCFMYMSIYQLSLLHTKHILHGRCDGLKAYGWNLYTSEVDSGSVLFPLKSNSKVYGLYFYNLNICQYWSVNITGISSSTSTETIHYDNIWWHSNLHDSSIAQKHLRVGEQCIQ